MPKRPKDVEVIPAPQWGQIAGRLHAEYIGKQDITDAIDKGDGVKWLARAIRRRLRRLEKPEGSVPQKARMPIPRSLRQQFAELFDEKNKEELDLELQAVEVALATNIAFQNPLYYEREVSEGLSAVTFIKESGPVTPEEWRMLDFAERQQVAALVAAGCWSNAPWVGEPAAAAWAQNLLLHKAGKLWYRHVQGWNFTFQQIIRELDEWPGSDMEGTGKGLVAYLLQFKERLGAIALNWKDPVYETILTPLAKLWEKTPYIHAKPQSTKDSAQSLQNDLWQLSWQLKETIRGQLAKDNALAEEFLATLPDPRQMDHEEASRLAYAMVEENRMLQPKNAAEASAEDHVEKCDHTVSACTLLGKFYRRWDYLTEERKKQLIEAARAKLHKT